MYFFTKFCRICVQTDVELTNLEAMDFDCIKLSDKLETCARLVVTGESMPSQICKACTNKLRVSYQFQEMCKKSTKIIQGYLSKLMEYSNDTDETFENWDLEVSVAPLPRLGIVKVANSAGNVLKTNPNDSQTCVKNTTDECPMGLKYEPMFDQSEESSQTTTQIIFEECPFRAKKVQPDQPECLINPKNFQNGEKIDVSELSSQDISQKYRIRVKNFENEPIVDQPKASSSQNVLSKIEKVVKDVPATFKKQQKARITKEKRCSLLKKLLTPAPNENQKKDRDKNLTPTSSVKQGTGLENIISFTNNYKFVDKSSCTQLDKNSNVELSHIDKLERFSRNYFRRKSFSEFNNTVVYIIEHKDDFYDSSFDDSDYEDEFDDDSHEGKVTEELMVEPDIRIKNEVMDREEEDTQSTFDYIVDTTFDDELGLKIEEPIDPKQSLEDMDNLPNTERNRTSRIRVKEEFNSETDFDSEIKPEYVEMSDIGGMSMSPYNKTIPSNSASNPGPSFSSEFETYLNKYTSDSVNMLDKLVTNYPMEKQTFSPWNPRCRTRGRPPYISPHLMDQFKFQCFRCEKCNRNFKSPGYLKAHTSKVH